MTLMPLSDEIPHEARELSAELRRFFTSLNISVRRYAARRNYDPATVSRYLNGKRVPPWPFIHDLLAEVAENVGVPVQQDAYEIVRKLHRAALEKSNKQLYRVQILQDKLAEADKEYKRAELRERALLEAMRVRQRRIALLESETLQINSSLLEEREKVERLQNQLAQLVPAQDELGRLREEVSELRQQLARAHELSEQAEARCQELEEQLQSAEGAAQAGEEVREQEKLQAALQEAADAQAQADELREQLEILRENLGEQISPNKKRKRREKFLKRKVGAEGSWAKRSVDKTIEEIAASLMRINLQGGDVEVHVALKEIASTYSIHKVGELAIEIDKLSKNLSRILLMGFGESRSPGEVLQFIKAFGTVSMERGTNLASEVLTWYSWERSAADLMEMLKLLRGLKWHELAAHCLQRAAMYQPPSQLVELMGEATGDRDALLGYAASYREIDKLVSLASEMRRSNNETTLSEMFTILEQDHPVKYVKVREMMKMIGPLMD